MSGKYTFLKNMGKDNDSKEIQTIYLSVEKMLEDIQYNDNNLTYDLRMVRLNDKRKISQIKYYRRCTDSGLKEAKETIESTNKFLGVTVVRNKNKDEIIS